MATHSNTLFPVFIKIDQIDILLVGAGNVGLEKLEALLRNNPKANVTIVADRVLEGVRQLIAAHKQLVLIERPFEDTDLEGRDLVMLATDNRPLHEHIKVLTKQKHVLTNVADTPDLCDFYLGSVVIKDDLKIAISTNGKSPTIAKRIRSYLEEALPDSMQALLDNMNHIREQLRGDFNYKLKVMNEVTAGWFDKNQPNKNA